MARHVYMTSSCGVCGKASIDAVRGESAYDVSTDPLEIDAGMLAAFPDVLRAHQDAFDKTGGLHAAALFDGVTGDLLVVREDVGRHNAVDKVIGWAAMNDRIPLVGHVLLVSGRVAFEIAQKAAMAGIRRDRRRVGSVIARRRAGDRGGHDARGLSARAPYERVRGRAPHPHRFTDDSAARHMNRG